MKQKNYFEGRSWDGMSLGPESLWYQQGLVPLRSTGKFIENPVRPRRSKTPSQTFKNSRPSQFKPVGTSSGNQMFTGGTPFFDERTGQRVPNPPTTPQQPSSSQQSQPRQVEGIWWDGKSRGPESLMFQQGLIPNRVTGQFAPPAISNGSFGKGLGLAGSMAPATQESDLIRLLKGLRGNMYQGVIA